ncbi:DUF4400 domain-containing protein [Pseudorhodoferax sp. Leaf267]|uniref:DUF4400 domain-containing protein n=1 Tax=Pseudorhodoferax sp. Leaf267 TaxID=1736316 RepID=UPI0006F3B020|nr:DUF4400 domain-containing protein [Pseudorhodoferax sp. Leaf267]KQP23363.1 hypothetical protein ASF43_05755 [Pseudorhodoferax sp. Leaf267]
MIRGVSIVSLLAVLSLVLYVPAIHGPADILQVLRQEHGRTAALWGEERAGRQLDQALRLQTGAADASPLPRAVAAPPQTGVDRAVATEMGVVTQRLFANRYMRSVDAILLLASYRLAGLWAWLPWLLPVALAATADGALRRQIKAREFLHHDPELFALWCCLLILLGCATVVALVLPVALHPLALALAPLAMALLTGLAVASFHRRA